MWLKWLCFILSIFSVLPHQHGERSSSVESDRFSFKFSSPLTAVVLVSKDRTYYSDSLYRKLMKSTTTESPMIIFEQEITRSRKVMFPISVILIEVLDATYLVS